MSVSFKTPFFFRPLILEVRGTSKRTPDEDFLFAFFLSFFLSLSLGRNLEQATNGDEEEMRTMALYFALVVVINAVLVDAYFADWSVLARDREPMCVPIPSNLTLCRDIGYTKMRLPNLLDHDTMQEVSQQAASWVPLLNIKCHEDTQLFLCSLFAPVCLERTIYPCRSLCEKVQAGCKGTMANYGFPWPAMLDCDKFPLDNDMCIASRNVQQQQKVQEEEQQQVRGGGISPSTSRGETRL